MLWGMQRANTKFTANMKGTRQPSSVDTTPPVLDQFGKFLYPYSYAGRTSDLWRGPIEHFCFGITTRKHRCNNPARRATQTKDVRCRQSALVLLAEVHEKQEAPSALTEEFTNNLRLFMSLQHCQYHRPRVENAVDEWKERYNTTVSAATAAAAASTEDEHEDGNDEDGNDIDDGGGGDDCDNRSINFSVSSRVSADTSSLWNIDDTPPASPIGTPDTTPQKQKTTSYIPLETPTRAERSTMRSKASARKYHGIALVSSQKSQRPAAVDRSPVVTAGEESEEYGYSENESAGDEDEDEDEIQSASTTRPQASPSHAVNTTTGKLRAKYEYRDLYIGANYLKIITAMQSSHNCKEGRVYVLHDPLKPNLCKIGCSGQKDLGKRHSSPICSKRAFVNNKGSVFESEVKFSGAFKVEALVKASLHHKLMKGPCPDCNNTHTEWFEVDKKLITKWIRVWTAYVQSEYIYDGNGCLKSDYYNDFAHRLLRITPDRVAAQLNYLPPQPPLPSPSPLCASRSTDRQSDTHETEDVPPPPLRRNPTATKIAAAATSVQRLVRRATGDRGIGAVFSSSKGKEKQRPTVTVQELGDTSDGTDSEDDRHGPSRRPLNKASRWLRRSSQKSSR